MSVTMISDLLLLLLLLENELLVEDQWLAPSGGLFSIDLKLTLCLF
jgi:hypothetical protein